MTPNWYGDKWMISKKNFDRKMDEKQEVHSENSDPICQNPNMTPNLGYGDKWVITLSEKSIRIKGFPEQVVIGQLHDSG